MSAECYCAVAARECGGVQERLDFVGRVIDQAASLGFLFSCVVGFPRRAGD